MLNYKASDGCDAMKKLTFNRAQDLHNLLICPSVCIVMFDADQENVQTLYFLYIKYQDFVFIKEI